MTRTELSAKKELELSEDAQQGRVDDGQLEGIQNAGTATHPRKVIVFSY